MTAPKAAAKPLKKTLGQRLLNVAALLGVWGAIMLVMLEVIGRIFDPFGISYFPETARFFDAVILEEPIGYRLPPNHHGRYFGADVNINSHGLRGPEFPAEKPPGERRILVLGDSVVFGIGVEDDETIPAVVERLANEHTDGGARYRVINMGVASYNTEQELIQLETLGLKLQPDAVILLYSPNDIEEKMWVFAKRASPIVDFAQRSYAASFLFSLRRWMSQAAGGSVSRIDLSQYDVPDHPGRRAVAESLAKIDAVCEANGLPFVVFVRDQRKAGPHRLVESVGEAEGFPVVLLDPWTDPRWEHLDRSEYGNSRVDPHANAAGCVIWGQLLHELLIAQHIIE